MDQPIPTYENQDLERIVIRDFGSEKVQEVRHILELYSTEDWQQGALRVWMACLKLADRNIEELKRYVEIACQDYRDVLAWAEYSAYMNAKNDKEKNEAIKSDWKELQKWLHHP